MRGTIKIRNIKARPGDTAVFVRDDLDGEYLVNSWLDRSEIFKLVDAPLEVSGAITVGNDGEEEFTLETYRLLFPLQEDFEDYWYLAEAGGGEHLESFVGYRY